MSEWRERTNAYLFHSQNLLNGLDHELSTVQRGFANSILEASKLCLRESLSCWLKELAEYTGHPQSNVRDVEEFAVSPAAQMPEGQRLINLKMTPNTWLSELLIILRPPTSSSAENRAPSLSELTLLDVAPESAEQALSSILGQFKLYIESVRAQQLEW